MLKSRRGRKIISSERQRKTESSIVGVDFHCGFAHGDGTVLFPCLGLHLMFCESRGSSSFGGGRGFLGLLLVLDVLDGVSDFAGGLDLLLDGGVVVHFNVEDGYRVLGFVVLFG